MSSRERWTAFSRKVDRAREEILAEAAPAFDELIATEVLDPVPLSSALSEFHARMLALEKKIDDSWERSPPSSMSRPRATRLLERGGEGAAGNRKQVARAEVKSSRRGACDLRDRGGGDGEGARRDEMRAVRSADRPGRLPRGEQRDV